MWFNVLLSVLWSLSSFLVKESIEKTALDHYFIGDSSERPDNDLLWKSRKTSGNNFMWDRSKTSSNDLMLDAKKKSKNDPLFWDGREVSGDELLWRARKTHEDGSFWGESKALGKLDNLFSFRFHPSFTFFAKPWAKQSPINIVTCDTVTVKCRPLVFEGHWNLDANHTIIENNGQTVQIEEDSDNVRLPFLHGGPLKGKYTYSQAHFHWGKTSKVGCEHTIDGNRSAMEVHIVHFHSDYRDFKEARRHENGICVVAFLLKVIPSPKSEPNSTFNLITHHLNKTKFLGRDRAEPNILTFLRELATPGDYFYYYGSLTTAPYSESVQWIIYKNQFSISETQIEKFRQQMRGKRFLTSNWRKTQPLHGRTVFYVKATENDEYPNDYNDFNIDPFFL